MDRVTEVMTTPSIKSAPFLTGYFWYSFKFLPFLELERPSWPGYNENKTVLRFNTKRSYKLMQKTWVAVVGFLLCNKVILPLSVFH